MSRVSVAGMVCTIAGLAAYLHGLTVAYPGRAFSLTAVMTGLTLVAVGYSTPLEEAV